MTPKKLVQQVLEALPDSCSLAEIREVLDSHIARFDEIRSAQHEVMSGAAARFEIDRYQA